MFGVYVIHVELPPKFRLWQVAIIVVYAGLFLAFTLARLRLMALTNALILSLSIGLSLWLIEVVLGEWSSNGEKLANTEWPSPLWEGASGFDPSIGPVHIPGS